MESSRGELNAKMDEKQIKEVRLGYCKDTVV